MYNIDKVKLMLLRLKLNFQVEINTKRPGTLISSNFTQKQKVSSTHSEGYFSSEDDTKRKTDQLSEKLKQLGNSILFSLLYKITFKY